MNKTERQRMNKLAQLPCLIDNEDCGGRLEIHHLTDGGRRIGHMDTIRLCFNHHQAQSPLPVGKAYHKGKKLFLSNYGSNDDLLALQNVALEAME